MQHIVLNLYVYHNELAWYLFWKEGLTIQTRIHIIAGKELGMSHFHAYIGSETDTKGS